MARQALVAQALNRTGLTETYATVTVADGASFPYDAQTRTLLRIKNTGASVATVTVKIAESIDGVTPAGKTVSVPATTGIKNMGPFPSAYKQSDGKVYIDTDQPVDIAVIQLASS